MRINVFMVLILAGLLGSGPVKESQITLNTAARQLPLTLVYPDGNSPLPIIIFSHSAGASGETYQPLAWHWAQEGYIVLLPTHADSMRLRLQTSAPTSRPGRQHGVALQMIANPRAWETRARDISLCIDQLDQIEKLVPPLAGRLDPDHIGVGGHSHGAQTAMLVGGATVDVSSSTKPVSFQDHRVKAILVLSGPGPGQLGLTPRSWDQIKIPMLVMTGSRDRDAQDQGPDSKKAPYLRSPPGDKYLVFIEGANHLSFTCRFAQAAGDWAIFDAVEGTTTAFWNACLKDNSRAKQRLREGRQWPCTTIEFR